MRNLFILISLFACGCSFGLGEATTKAQDKIPPNLLGKGPMDVVKIRRYLFNTGEVTLHFYLDGTHEGKGISFLVSFSRSAKLESRATLRVKDEETHTDYRLDPGSKLAQKLAQRIRLKLPGNSEADPPESADAHLFKNSDPPRIKALRTLLNGNYSWKHPPD